MSNILDIPQIPTTAIELLQNDLHIGFTGDLKIQPKPFWGRFAQNCKKIIKKL